MSAVLAGIATQAAGGAAAGGAAAGGAAAGGAAAGGAGGLAQILKGLMGGKAGGLPFGFKNKHFAVGNLRGQQGGQGGEGGTELERLLLKLLQQRGGGQQRPQQQPLPISAIGGGGGGIPIGGGGIPNFAGLIRGGGVPQKLP